MTDNRVGRIGVALDIKPHAYDPAANPELFDGVLPRRVTAFVIDAIIILLPAVFAAVFIFLFGLVTLGVGWLLFALLTPATVIWAIVYHGMTLGAPASATIGMRMTGLEMRTWYGGPTYFVLGVVHAVVFCVLVSFLTPLILLVGLLNERRRLLHDIVVGTVVINNRAHADFVRQMSWGA